MMVVEWENTNTQARGQEKMYQLGGLKISEASESVVLNILAKKQSWADLPHTFDMSADDERILSQLGDPSLSITKKYEILNHLESMMLVLKIMNAFRPTDPGRTYEKVGFLAVILHEVVREDFGRYEKLLALGDKKYKQSIHEILFKLMKLIPHSLYADKTAILAAGFMVHNEYKRIDLNVLETFVNTLIDKVTKCSSQGVLHALASLLKIRQCRSSLWNVTGVHILIRANLNYEKADSRCQYLAAFCVWLYTLAPKYIFHLNESGLLLRVFQLLQKVPREEKIVRLAVEAIDNCLLSEQDEPIETMVNVKIGETLDILEFEKWRSKELYERIAEVKKNYFERVKHFSTFQRYVTELHRGELHWGYLHSAQFWNDNVMQFENKQFQAITKLSQILRGSSSESIAVACYDLGEFARLHPTGKRVLATLDVKTTLLELMKHKDREVQKQSLLAIQKLMLQNWQGIKTTATN